MTQTHFEAEITTLGWYEEISSVISRLGQRSGSIHSVNILLKCDVIILFTINQLNLL